MQRLIGYVTVVIQRPPTVADLNAITLAAITYHARGKMRLSLRTVGTYKQEFRSVWRIAAKQGLVAHLPIQYTRSVRGSRKSLSKEMKDRIVCAVRMQAAGRTCKDIARRFRLTPEAIHGWRKRHREFWDSALDAAMQQELQNLQQLAGSNQPIKPPDFTRMVERCEHWARSRDQTLFPAPPADMTQADPGLHTVPSFLKCYMIPCCLQEAAEETVDLYRRVAAKFARTMGNPPLCKITNVTLASYRDILKKMPARAKGGKPLSINTVIMYLSILQTILDKAGPPARNRDAAGYINAVPWVKLPREDLGEAKIVADELLQACYEAAAKMTRPKIAPAWWRALLVTTRYLGVRSRTLFAMEWRHVEWESRRVRLPAALLKGRKMLVLPLPAIVTEHLLAIRRDNGRVFDWPHSRQHFLKCFHRLQNAAGIPLDKHFGLHVLRKTAITQLWKISPAAAQLLAGHGSPITTRKSYVNLEEVLREAMAGVGSFVTVGKVGAA